MRNLIKIVVCMYMATSTSEAFAADVEQGVVIVASDACDHFIVEVRGGWYIVLQDYYNKGVAVGDVVVGEMRTYGFTDMLWNGKGIKIYREGWWGSKGTAFEKMAEKCH